MFVTLVGVTYLFGMASNNGTLELFSKKVVALVGKYTVLIPILMFVLSAFISAIGPGHIAAGISRLYHPLEVFCHGRIAYLMISYS